MNKLAALKPPREELVKEESFVFGYLVPLLHMLRVVENLAWNKSLLKKLPRSQGQAFWKFRKKFSEVPFWGELHLFSTTKTRTFAAIRFGIRHDNVADLILEFHDCVSHNCSNS